MVHLELPPFAALVRAYLESLRQRNRAPSTQRHQGVLLARAARELPAQPDARTVRGWLGRQIEAGQLAPASANNYLRVLKSVYSLATDDHGVPNLLRHVAEFPVPARRARAFPADGPGGRLGLVERWIAGCCANDVERAFLWVLYDAGLREQEALGVEPEAVDLALGRLDVRAQREADGEAVRPPKTRGSRAVISLSGEACRWIERALRAPERASWGGAGRGADKRARLAGRFVFPLTGRMLDNLMGRLRAASPECFPRRVVGVRGGDRWHPFRHARASDLHDAGCTVEEIGRQLRHTHFEWTQGYVDAYRGRLALMETGTAVKVAAHREAARRAFEAAAGVARIEAAGVLGVGARTPGTIEGVYNTGDGGVESREIGGVGCRPRSSGSTGNTGHHNTGHATPSAAATRLPFPPYPVTPRASKARAVAKARKGGR